MAIAVAAVAAGMRDPKDPLNQVGRPVHSDTEASLT
jgi:hypothetical protein